MKDALSRKALVSMSAQLDHLALLLCSIAATGRKNNVGIEYGLGYAGENQRKHNQRALDKIEKAIAHIETLSPLLYGMDDHLETIDKYAKTFVTLKDLQTIRDQDA